MKCPILKIITVRQGTPYEGSYLVVIEKNPYKSLASFGNANNEENWLTAIGFLLEAKTQYYREFYEKKMRAHLSFNRS